VNGRQPTATFARFLVAGGSAALLNLLLLWVFTSILGFWYLLSSLLSYALSMFYNFFLQRDWTFPGARGRAHRQLPQFVAVNLAGLLLNTAILYLLVDVLSIWYLAAAATASVVVAMQSYFAYRWIFVRRSSCNGLGSIPFDHPRVLLVKNT
jgi:dolichol-phosphate mannosyltransferase